MFAHMCGGRTPAEVGRLARAGFKRDVPLAALALLLLSVALIGWSTSPLQRSAVSFLGAPHPQKSSPHVIELDGPRTVDGQQILEVFLVYATKEVAIVVPDDSDIANGIELTAGMCKWDTGVAVPMERHYKTTGPYKSRGLHLCPVPPNAMKILRQAPPAGVAACVNFWMSFSLPHSFFSQIMRVAFRQEGIQQRVCSHGLRPEQVGFVPVVEATKAMYIENELMRDTTLSPLRTALPWLEYHLKHGVSRHILHVSLPAEQSEAAALKQFWLEMYAPYLTGGEVILVLHHGRDRKPSGGGVKVRGELPHGSREYSRRQRSSSGHRSRSAGIQFQHRGRRAGQRGDAGG